MSDYWKAIKLAAVQGYRADLETGTIFGKSGERLQVKRVGKQAYPTIRLHISGLSNRAYSVPAHKFVAFLIWGDAAFQGRRVHVRHRDGNTENNARRNLLLGTPQQNEMDKPAKVRSASARAARAAQGQIPQNAKLTPEKAAFIREELNRARGVTGRVRRGVVQFLALKFDVSPSAISLVGKGKTWNV